MGKCWPKGTKFQFYRINKSRDLVYSMVITVSNTVLNTGNLLRKWISGAFRTHTIMLTL